MGAAMTNRRSSGHATGRTLRIAGLGALVWMAAALPARLRGGTENKLDELWLSGQPGAAVKIEVFSDYQCPHCRVFYLDTIKPLIASFTRENKINDLYIVYHDLPLDMHQYARKAASYALAAERVSHDAWLRVSDALYREQAQWAQDGNIEAVISRVLEGTELAQVKKLVTDPEIAEEMHSELMLAQSRQIRATPTFFIVSSAGRQERVSGTVPYDLLRSHLEQFLK